MTTPRSITETVPDSIRAEQRKDAEATLVKRPSFLSTPECDLRSDR